MKIQIANIKGIKFLLLSVVVHFLTGEVIGYIFVPRG